MLVLARKIGESFMIGDNIEVFVSEIAGDRVRIGIEAPKEIQIFRKEIYLTIQSNRLAAIKVSPIKLKGLLKGFKSPPPRPHQG